MANWGFAGNPGGDLGGLGEKGHLSLAIDALISVSSLGVGEGSGEGDIDGVGVVTALTGVLGGDSDLVDLGGELVSLRGPDEVQIPPRNKTSVFWLAMQCVSKCWFKFSITFALK